MKIKRILAATAAAAVTVSALPLAVFAENETQSVIVKIANQTFSKDDGAAWDGLLLTAVVPINEDTTMLSAITEAVENAGYTISAPDYGYGAYISDIYDVGETTYAVLDGYYPGWNVSLNQWFTNQGISAYTVKDGTLADGDVISLEYTITSYDVGNKWSSTDTSLMSVYIGNELYEDFKPDQFEYDVTLDSEELALTPVPSNRVFQTWKYLNTYSPDVSGSGFRPQDTMSVKDGDTVYVGVGNENWPSSYWGTDPVNESVYTFHIHIDEPSPEDKEAAEAVEKLIDNIGEVTLDSGDAISAACIAYLALTDEQKELVSNSADLIDAVREYTELKAEEAKRVYEKMFADTIDRVSLEDAVIGNEWKAIGLARNGKYSDEQKDKMIKAIAEYADKAVDGKLNQRRCTENAKEAITAAALGYDPTDINGVDLLAPLADKDYVSKQGIVGYIWSNIAYTSVGREAPYVQELLDMQLENGAFSFDGETADVDITAMALTSLRGQRAHDDEIVAAMEWLSDALFENDAVHSSESLSQIMIACNAHQGIVLYDTSFVTLLAEYYLGGGEFAHETGSGYDGMATEQALLAMTANYFTENTQAALYGFTDTELVPFRYKGDVNGDGKVNMKDLVLLQRYLNNWPVEIDLDTADLTGDEKVNMKDYVALQRVLNGWGN